MAAEFECGDDLLALLDGKERESSAAEGLSPAPRYLLQFAAALIADAAWSARGGEPAARVGHSMGEIAALTAAGALSIEDGARLICLRVRALEKDYRQGGMLALGTRADRARAVTAAVDDPRLAVACENAPRQTVISGPSGALEPVIAVCGALGVRCTPIDAPYAYHNRRLAPAAAALTDSARHLRRRPPRGVVCSPTLGRDVTAADDPVAVVAEALTRPVMFAEAIRRLHAAGAQTFVECGPGRVLARCVEATVPDVHTESSLEPDRRSAGPPPTPKSEPPTPATEPPTPATEPPTPAAEPPTPATEPATPTPEPAASTPERAAPKPEPAASPDPRAAAHPTDRRQDILRELREMYAARLGYPPEALAEDAELEVDLGVDSIKQAELLTRVGEQYGLPSPAENARLSDLLTLADVADLVADHLDDPERPAT
ncbi:acyltransferase domain-containing protein [Actinomadura rubrisoli]|uniref:Acyltransferase domain-containing protein n=1 Tax=Actinomadura rubrisoli TaxID=2530368 RepID=A0A4R5C2F2_9ACTN|nr:acyltransferase domain-containing protein [Actinomadura rubrisoli]TDD93801.1 acyltransferase domain-containing protein [Actinomadura rubrisoli]